MDKKKLFAQAISKYLLGVILMGAILFLPAWSFCYWNAWLFMGILFVPMYLLYCWYMAKRNMDNIGHTAHFWGAVYGLLFPLACRPDIFQHFLNQLGLI